MPPGLRRSRRRRRSLASAGPKRRAFRAGRAAAQHEATIRAQPAIESLRSTIFGQQRTNDALRARTDLLQAEVSRHRRRFARDDRHRSPRPCCSRRAALGARSRGSDRTRERDGHRERRAPSPARARLAAAISSRPSCKRALAPLSRHACSGRGPRSCASAPCARAARARCYADRALLRWPPQAARNGRVRRRDVEARATRRARARGRRARARRAAGRARTHQARRSAAPSSRRQRARLGLVRAIGATDSATARSGAAAAPLPDSELTGGDRPTFG